MNQCEQTYQEALIRTLRESVRCLSYRNAYNALWAIAPSTSWSFFSYSSLALYDGMISHAIKILDRHRDASSFFYLHTCDAKALEKALQDAHLTFAQVSTFSQKLKIIRDKTHFHIDKGAVLHPNEIWTQAGITGDQFNQVMDGLWHALNSIYLSLFEHEFLEPIYAGHDIKSIVEAAQARGITI